MEHIKKWYVKYFVLRFTLVYSIFVLMHTFYFSYSGFLFCFESKSYSEALLNLFFRPFLNICLAYCFFKVLSINRYLYLVGTYFLFIITGYAIVLEITQHIFLSPEIIFSTFEATSKEVFPLIGSFIMSTLIFSAIYFCMIYFNFFSKIFFKNKKKYFSLIFIIFMIKPSILDMIVSKTFHFELIQGVSYPQYLFRSVVEAVKAKRSADNRHYKSYSKNIIYQNPHKLITVMYVGESAREDHFSINGYTKYPVNQFLKKEVFSFGMVKSCDNLTFKSIPCMLTSFTEKTAYQKRYQEAGISTLFKGKGVSVMSMGDIQNTLYKRYINFKPFFTSNLLKDIDKLFQEKLLLGKKNQFFLLRTVGSHVSYRTNYPQSFSYLKGDNIVNYYDNSIYYTEHLIENIVGALKKEKRPALFMYSSDHGESLGENGFYLHGNTTVENRMVELFVYVNDAYKKDYPQKYQALVKNTKLYKDQITHNVLWHSLLDGSGFSNKKKGNFPINKELSIFSNQLKPELKKDWYKVNYKRF